MTPELNAETQALYDAAQGNFTPPAQEETGSLAEHEAQFSNQPRVVEEADDEPVAPVRHRAKTQRATPDDVEKINTLTARLRAAESDLGVTVEREEGESDRVYNLRRRAELAEAVREAKRAAVAPKPTATLPPVAAQAEFAEKEPTIYDFKFNADGTENEDPYTPWQRALGAYDRRKEAWDARQQESQQQPHREAMAANQRILGAYGEGAKSFAAATPDFNAVIEAVGDRPMPAAMHSAIVSDAKNGPRYAYLMAKSDEIFDDLFAFSASMPVNEHTVAMVQRRLATRMPAADTGSAAPTTRPLTPRPPNPVRTVPTMRTSSRPPGESASLDDHERAYPVSRR